MSVHYCNLLVKTHSPVLCGAAGLPRGPRERERKRKKLSALFECLFSVIEHANGLQNSLSIFRAPAVAADDSVFARRTLAEIKMNGFAI